ncbi:MAG TPA: SH3 domain-containing protein [Bryobacteraceae bacterium]|nr:SH3 domain-containing protein [Bryobacteraceae bacterium]
MKLSSISKVTVTAVLVMGVGCTTGPRRTDPIGEAYVGPATLKIRGEISMQSRTVATVKHGDRLEILQRHRLFLRVRAPNGAEGWTDDWQLLAASDMAALKELSRRAAHLPSQGQAFSFREMTVHTLPNAKSPSLLTLPANQKVDVVAHMRTERKDLPRTPLIPPAPKRVRNYRPSQARASRYPVPPMPKPPAPPANWLDLSKTDPDVDEAPEPTPEPKVIPTDDWSLVRTASGQSGWVLTRRLVMAIPDEVAQYAEGKRIVSYFPLTSVMDGGQKKSFWLWTTSESGPQPYDFESFRVFIWSLKRHRYETAYIERNIHGFAPVLVHDVDYAPQTRSRGEAETEKYPGFSVCEEDDSGQRQRREYALLGNIVRFAGEQPCEAPAPPLVTLDATPGKAGAPVTAAAPAAGGETLTQRFRRRLRTFTKGLFSIFQSGNHAGIGNRF